MEGDDWFTPDKMTMHQRVVVPIKMFRPNRQSIAPGGEGSACLAPTQRVVVVVGRAKKNYKYVQSHSFNRYRSSESTRNRRYL